MNERIKELAGQAKLIAEETINRKISKNAELDAFAEKFAELIVRECLMIVYERQERAPTDDDGYFKVALDLVSKDIEQHFGVEE